MVNTDLRFKVIIDLSKININGATNPNYRVITLEDTTNYSSLGIPLSQLSGIFIVKDPLNNTIHQGTFTSPDIVQEISTEFSGVNIPLDSYNQPLNGEYTFQMIVRNTYDDYNNQYTDYQTSEVKVDVCNSCTQGEVELTFDCNRGYAYGKDLTKYKSNASVSRILTLAPPIGAKYIDGSDATPFQTTSKNIQSNALWTQTWQALLRSVFTENGTKGVLTYEILSSIEVRKDAQATCNINLCSLYNCFEKKIVELERKANRLGGITNSYIGEEMVQLTNAYMQLQVARECGDGDKAQKYYNELKGLLDCDCGCGNSNMPEFVNPLVPPTGDTTMVEGSQYIAVTGNTVGNTTTYTVAISSVLSNLIQLIKSYDIESGDDTIDVSKTVNGTSVLFDIRVNTEEVDYILGEEIDSKSIGGDTLTEIVQNLIDLADEGGEAPVAEPDLAITTEATPVSVLVTANDFFSSNVVTTIKTAPNNGTAVIESDGKTITYTPGSAGGDKYVNVPSNYTNRTGSFSFQESGLIPNDHSFSTVGSDSISIALTIKYITSDGTEITKVKSIIASSGFNFSAFTTLVKMLFDDIKSELPTNGLIFEIGSSPMPYFSIKAGNGDNFYIDFQIASGADFIENPDDIINIDYSGSTFYLEKTYTSSGYHFKGLYRSKFDLLITKSDNTKDVIMFYDLTPKLYIPNDYIIATRFIGDINYTYGHNTIPPDLEIFEESVNFIGTDVLTYTITDAQGRTSDATLTIIVDAVSGASCVTITAQFVASLSVQAGKIQVALTNLTNYLTNIPNTNTYVIEVRDSSNNVLYTHNVTGNNNSIGQVFTIPEAPDITWNNIRVTQTVTSKNEVGSSCGTTTSSNSYTMPDVSSSIFAGVTVTCLGVTNADPDTVIMQALVSKACASITTVNTINGVSGNGSNANPVKLGGELTEDTGIYGDKSLILRPNYFEVDKFDNKVGVPTSQMFDKALIDEIPEVGEGHFGHKKQTRIFFDNVTFNTTTRENLYTNHNTGLTISGDNAVISSPLDINGNIAYGVANSFFGIDVRQDNVSVEFGRLINQWIDGIYGKHLQSGTILVNEYIQHFIRRQDAGIPGQFVLATNRYATYQEGDDDDSYFAGEVTFNQAPVTPSDERSKEVLGNYEKGLDEIKNLNVVRFTRKEGFGNTDIENIGVIAQEVEPVIPEAVNTGYDIKSKIEDFKTLKTDVLMYTLINAVKELSAKVEFLESKLNESND